jgi:hypothetical protein
MWRTRYFFCPEDGDDAILRNVGLHKLTRHYVPEDDNLHSHRRQNLKPCTEIGFVWKITPSYYQPASSNRKCLPLYLLKITFTAFSREHNLRPSSLH